MVRTTNRPQRWPHVRGAPCTSVKPNSLSPRAYDRCTELARVLPLWPHELADESPIGRLRDERRRGIAGHWTYDLARHAELLRIYRIEFSSLTAPNEEGLALLHRRR